MMIKNLLSQGKGIKLMYILSVNCDPRFYILCHKILSLRMVTNNAIHLISTGVPFSAQLNKVTASECANLMQPCEPNIRRPNTLTLLFATSGNIFRMWDDPKAAVSLTIVASPLCLTGSSI